VADDKFETNRDREEDSREIHLRKELLNIPIRALHPREALSVGPDATVAEAVNLMNQEKIGAILVVDNEKLVGIFTERDVLTKIAGRGYDFNKIYVDQYMTESPETLNVDSKVAYALNMMAVGGFRHVPLVDENHRAVAMISVRDIVGHIAELFPKDVLNLPMDPEHEIHNRWGG